MGIKNEDIRKKAKDAGIRLWEIADKMMMADCQFSRILRYELPQEEKEKIFNIIKELKEGEIE